MPFSVLMSVYGGERPEFLRQSLESLVAQSIRADEVVIVKDGMLGAELEGVLASYQEALPMVTVQLEKQAGLGRALSAGLAVCRNELVARMDSDDICVAHRFENQIAFCDKNPSVAAVGSTIGEFVDNPETIVSVRKLPCGGVELKKFAKFRNPLNHMTVMFRRSAVLAAGGYRDFPALEDYDLWARMLMLNLEICNMPEILVLVRCGDGMLRRRGGVSYARSEMRLFRQFLRMGFISAPEFALNVLVRTPVRIMPAALRPLVYGRLLRHEGRSL
jgi:glycosyltransferase involved in cell wall biosynthesis